MIPTLEGEFHVTISVLVAAAVWLVLCCNCFSLLLFLLCHVCCSICGFLARRGARSCFTVCGVLQNSWVQKLPCWFCCRVCLRQNGVVQKLVLSFPAADSKVALVNASCAVLLCMRIAERLRSLCSLWGIRTFDRGSKYRVLTPN